MPVDPNGVQVLAAVFAYCRRRASFVGRTAIGGKPAVGPNSRRQRRSIHIAISYTTACGSATTSDRNSAAKSTGIMPMQRRKQYVSMATSSQESSMRRTTSTGHLLVRPRRPSQTRRGTLTRRGGGCQKAKAFRKRARLGWRFSCAHATTRPRISTARRVKGQGLVGGIARAGLRRGGGRCGCVDASLHKLLQTLTRTAPPPKRSLKRRASTAQPMSTHDPPTFLFLPPLR